MNKPEDLPLRDIHLPADPSWWPPAPGWWILIVLLLSVVAGIWWLYRRRQQAKLSTANLANESLFALRQQYSEKQDAQVLIRELSVLLRRVSITTFPRVDTAGLTGMDWLRFLDKGVSGNEFSQGSGRILMDAPYRARVEKEELGALLDLCESWIVAVTKRKGREAE